jgi:hypothetical protein
MVMETVMSNWGPVTGMVMFMLLLINMGIMMMQVGPVVMAVEMMRISLPVCGCVGM